MIVLDASVLIAHLDAGDRHHERAESLLADRARDVLGASPLTLAEVLVAPARAGRLDQAMTALAELGIAAIPLVDDALPQLATLRATTNLKLPDCCVLLTAETTQAAIATFDERLAAAAEDRGLPVHGRAAR